MRMLAKSENYVAPIERRFDQWLAQVEGKLGYKLPDDDQSWSLFKDGCDVEDAVTELQD